MNAPRALAAAALLAGARGAAADPMLSVMPASVDAGRVELSDAAATATVRITNTGTGPLKLLALQLLDGGTGAATDWTAMPGAPCSAGVPPSCALTDTLFTDVALAFAPRSIGVRDATLLVNYHDTADRSISIPLHGVGVGPTLALVAAPTVLDFGTLPVGVAAELTLQVANHGTRDLTDGELAIAQPGPFTTSPGKLVVTAAAMTPITLTCKPASTGTFTATLQLSAPDVPGPPIELDLRCAGDPAQTLVATPPAILLGEVRLSAPAHADLAITEGGMVALTAALVPPIPGLTVTVPAPATLHLAAAPIADGSLDTKLVVTPETGAPLAIPVTGSAVTARASVPPAVSLGTFCVQQPTTPRLVALTATGSATVGVSAPVLQDPASPFDLARIAPLDYPGMLAPQERAFVAITPRPRSVAGTASDDLVWATDADVDGIPSHTSLTATFLADGGAIAPGMLVFGQVQIHVDARNAQQVTLQNCSAAAFQLDPPQVPAPFSIDSPNFPTALKPGEAATFSVGFHPTQPLAVTKTLIITSPQLPAPLKVDLSGEGIANGGDTDAGPSSAGLSSTSFYACGGCATDDPSGALAVALAALAAAVPRRRRAR
ncbi:MAG TPA: choice-of-anchor D domain-containing protein [Kofleriaceae bacterium]|jgi:MYXO-CTERM domain-containing protein|nr:choice-of-anchor D domain-containing protein [Kofleriaceae bacterium]